MVFLLLGAIVNVAVAWGCTWWPPVFHNWDEYAQGLTRHGEGFNDWFVDVSRVRGWKQVFSRWWTTGASTFENADLPQQADAVLPPWASSARPRGNDPPDMEVFIIVDARGWPALSMKSSYESRQSVLSFAPTIARKMAVTSGVLMPAERAKPYTHFGMLRVLPVSPIWPGFAINTLFYGGVLWLLFAAPFAIRRRRRARRRLCPACAYPVGESAVCTECGRPVTIKQS